MVNSLIKANASLEIKDQNGRTALMGGKKKRTNYF
jgi:hypothetical protein